MTRAWQGRDVGPGDAALGGLGALLSIAGLLAALGFGGADGLEHELTVPPPIAVTVGIATEASLGLPPGRARPAARPHRTAEPDPPPPPKPASVEPSRDRPVVPSPTAPPAPTAPPSDEPQSDVEPAASPPGTAEPGDPVADDSPAGDPAAPDSGGEGSGGGDSDRQQQVWAILRSRLVRWFAMRFRVSGSGLEPDVLMKLQAHATVSISPDGIVESYVLSGSGNDVFDAAATRALEGTVGEHLPSSPGADSLSLPPTFSITFVCKPTTCD